MRSALARNLVTSAPPPFINILLLSFSPDFKYYDGLVISGGRSPEYLAVDAYVVELVRKFSDSKKPIASTCHGSCRLD